MEIDYLKYLDEDEQISVNKIEVRKSTLNRPPEELISKLPPHIQCLYDKSIKNLEKE